MIAAQWESCWSADQDPERLVRSGHSGELTVFATVLFEIRYARTAVDEFLVWFAGAEIWTVEEASDAIAGMHRTLEA